MRSLFRFILRYHFVILFVVLEIFSFLLLVQNNNYHNYSIITSSNQITGNIYKAFSSVTQYFSLKHTNDVLAQENAYYKSMRFDSFVLYSDTFNLYQDSSRQQKYLYIPAQVINNSVNKQDNYLTLNKGSKHGITTDMAVINSEGVVGVIKSVSDNFSTVISELNSNLKISTRIKRNNFFGSLHWDGRSPKRAKLSDIPIHVKLNKGDTLVTSGFSTIFPSGIMIGYISDFTQAEGSNFFDIDVELETEFQNLSKVYIVKNLLQNEQNELENKVNNND
ncbi:MAG: rod shape-determining protein MreC [Bacteroidetes bacterium GWA2_30_7]|nr:MAG: rod shape-determining protein MreC [Bacteroidetes bacterium GWA2_30_7]